jgi:hypothetical protein
MPGAGQLLLQQLIAGQQVGSFSTSLTTSAVSSSGLVFAQIDGKSWLADACADMCVRKATERLSSDRTCEEKRCEPSTGIEGTSEAGERLNYMQQMLHAAAGFLTAAAGAAAGYAYHCSSSYAPYTRCRTCKAT